MSERYKKWYDIHKETFNAKRRKDYEKTKVEAASKYAGMGKLSTNGRLIIELDGKNYASVMYTTLELVQNIGCTPAAIYKWEKQGVIPVTPFVDKSGDRYYSEDLVHLIRNILKKTGKLEKIIKNEKGIEYWMSVNPEQHVLERIMFYTRKKLCTILGITNEKLCDWEDRGLIPVSKFMDTESNVPIYSVKYVSLIQRIADKIEKCALTNDSSMYDYMTKRLDLETAYEPKYKCTKNDF